MKKKPSKADILKIISKILKMSPQKIEKIDDEYKHDSEKKNYYEKLLRFMKIL